MKIDAPGSGPNSNGGTVGAVVGVLVFILLLSVTAGSVGLLLVFLSKRRKKKKKAVSKNADGYTCCVHSFVYEHCNKVL